MVTCLTDDKLEPAELSPLIVWCAEMAAAAPVLGVLRQGYVVDVCTNLSQVETGISDKSPSILLLYQSPVETLCRAMEEKGDLPSTALRDWLEQAQEMVKLNRRNRRKVSILDINMATGHPGAFLRWFELSENEEQITALSRNGQPDRGEILQLLAQRTLMGDMRARALLGELEAASLSFQDGAVPLSGDPDAAFLQYQSIRQSRQQVSLLQAQNCVAQEEAETLNKRKIQLENALEQADEASILLQQQLEQRLEQLGQGLESYQVQVNKLHAQSAGLRRKIVEKERGIQGTGGMLRDLEAQATFLTEKLKRAEGRHAAKQQQLEALEQEMYEFTKSVPYRLTAPLRWIHALVSGRNPV
jgi:uncharacterized membrane-anchored protein YhcB (DUF1043 family)